MVLRKPSPEACCCVGFALERSRQPDANPMGGGRPMVGNKSAETGRECVRTAEVTGQAEEAQSFGSMADGMGI